MLDEDLPTEEEEQVFYLSLGRAITAWAELEALLFAITHTILGCVKERAAIVFYRTPTIRARLSLTYDLIQSYFPKHEAGKPPDPRIKQWKKLQSQITDILPFRNRLAHHPVGPVVNLHDNGLEAEVEIIQASYVSRAEALWKRDSSYPADVNEIRVHRQKVMRLVNDLRNFVGQHFKHLAS